MKSSILFIAVLTVCFSSCKKDDVIKEDVDIVVSEDNVNEILIAGTWYVAASTKSNGESNTEVYRDHTFDFKAANVLEITIAGQTELVGWQAGSGSSGVKIEFEVPFNLPQQIRNIGDGKWYVTRLTKTRLTMQERDNTTQEITLRKD